MTDEIRAFHESGHACAHHHFSHPVSEVAIGGDDGGYCAFARGAKRYFSDDETKALKQREAHLEQAITCCAGKYAVAALNGRRADYGWKRSEDRAQALRYCLAYCDGDEVAAELLLAYAMRRAELLVEKRWPQIHKLAFGLLEHEKLTGEQVKQI